VARLPEVFNTGDKTDITPEQLLILIERMYIDIAEAVNSKPDLYQREDTAGPNSGDGQPGDTFLAQGSININLSTNKVEMLTSHVSQTVVTWTKLSP
jgi:hypothetical protein